MVRAGALDACVDVYEWPNVPGAYPDLDLSALPEQGVTGKDLDSLCRSVGKRLCTRDEWVAACEGTDVSTCNVNQAWRAPNEALVAARDDRELTRLRQNWPSGAEDRKAPCVSASGAEDMLGNVEEWVRCDNGYDGYCLMGRFWSEAVSCTFTVKTHAARWHYYETGGRCCAEAE